jgi:hypothetical protein
MKKILILLLFGPLAFGQSVELKPNAYDSGLLEIKNSLNMPGLVHSSSVPGGPSMGTVIKADGAYLQTFTNHALNFAVNNGSALLTVNTAGNVQISNATTFFSGIKIMQKKIAGIIDGYDGITQATNDGLPNETRIAHGLDASKIISVKMVIIVATGFSIGEEYSYQPGHKAAISYDNTFIHVWNGTTSGGAIRNKPFKILITYKV